MRNQIQYLPRHQLDTIKWDQCIDQSANGLIYAYSFYLDHMSTDWDALIWNDYEVVMPLPKRKKWGIQYVYQPAFTASLGIFGNGLTEELVQEFVQAIPPKFKLIDTYLNFGNIFSSPSGFNKLHNNFVLSLQPSYERLYNSYSKNIQRNIKRAQQLNNRYTTNVNIEEIITLSRQKMESVSNVTEEDYANFTKLYNYLYEKQQAITCGVYTATEELVASCVYFFSHNRAYYILVGNSPNGRTQGASHFLIDQFIHDHAGKPLLLDFEGSDIHSLAFFYSSFDAQLEVYPALYINRLPWLIKKVSGKN